MFDFSATKNQAPWDWLNRVFPYSPRPMPTPGVKNYAMYPGFSLPGQSVYGNGNVYGNGSSPIPPISATPQMMFHQAQVANGVQGITYGGVQPQGLVDMEKLVSAQAA